MVRVIIVMKDITKVCPLRKWLDDRMLPLEIKICPHSPKGDTSRKSRHSNSFEQNFSMIGSRDRTTSKSDNGNVDGKKGIIQTVFFYVPLPLAILALYLP